MVTADKALLWTDGRYHLQAEAQLDHNWTLMKAGLPTVLRLEEWLAKVRARDRSCYHYHGDGVGANSRRSCRN